MLESYSVNKCKCEGLLDERALVPERPASPPPRPNKAHDPRINHWLLYYFSGQSDEQHTKMPKGSVEPLELFGVA